MRKRPPLDLSGDTHYVVLGIPETATQDEIKRAYRHLIRRVHPDKFPDASPFWKLAVEQKSKRVIEAHDVLSDATQRSFYDQQLARSRQQASAPRTCTLPPNPGSQPRACQSEPNWRSLPISAFWGGVLITATVLLILLSIIFEIITFADPA